MQKAFNKLKSIFAGITTDEGETIIHFSNVKFVAKNGNIICKDKDYWDLQEARIIDNERYLHRMSDIILSLNKSYIIDNRHKNIFKKNIRGMCRFNVVHPVQNIEEVKAELLVKSLREVAMKYGISENYCKKILKNG